jgi:hypothetical protein
MSVIYWQLGLQFWSSVVLDLLSISAWPLSFVNWTINGIASAIQLARLSTFSKGHGPNATIAETRQFFKFPIVLDAIPREQ